MKILIACEESQIVCKEFRKMGHESYSADIQTCSGGHPEWHIKGDVLKILNNEWDMMLAFPPCTHLASSGAHAFSEKIKDGRQKSAIEFFMQMVNAPIHKIAIENPIGIMSNIYRKPDQIIHPYYFGNPEPKSTCLWLKNLPKLLHFSENDLFDSKTWVEPEYIYSSTGKKYSRIHWLGGKKSKLKSKTYSGIAKAFAKQYG